MAKKKPTATEGPVEPTKTRDKRPESRVGLRLEISTDHRNRLLVASARRGQSMATCLRQVVSEWIDANEPIVTPPSHGKTSKPRKKKGVTA